MPIFTLKVRAQLLASGPPSHAEEHARGSPGSEELFLALMPYPTRGAGEEILQRAVIFRVQSQKGLF